MLVLRMLVLLLLMLLLMPVRFRTAPRSVCPVRVFIPLRLQAVRLLAGMAAAERHFKGLSPLSSWTSEASSLCISRELEKPDEEMASLSFLRGIVQCPRRGPHDVHGDGPGVVAHEGDLACGRPVCRCNRFKN